MDIVPEGGRKVAPKNQVSIPAELLAGIGVEVGDKVWLMSNPDRPGTLVLMSREAMAEVIRKGWSAI